MFRSEFIYQGFLGWFILGGIIGAVAAQYWAEPVFETYKALPTFIVTSMVGGLGFVVGALALSILGFIKVLIFPPSETGKEF